MATTLETSPDTDPTIRDAASIVLLRDRSTCPKILLGQRGEHAVFMPRKFVFPGGAVDQADSMIELSERPDQTNLRRLEQNSSPSLVDQLLLCAVRELWEETGLRLARQVSPRDQQLADCWQSFCADEFRPCAKNLTFIYRAITPPGRSRRFDARFFVGEVERVSLLSDPDDFKFASDELRHLHWASLDEAHKLDLPEITGRVLCAVQKWLSNPVSPSAVPFRYSEAGERIISWIH